jgi:outer membrane lipoprotein SlyB
MRSFLILAFAALALSGCAGNQPGRGELFSSKAEVEAKDDATCRGYGAKPGEPVYIQCRVAQDQRRDAFKKD